MPEELLRLAERVEGLDGPDREVDAAIWYAVFERPRPGDKIDKDIIGKWPRYTASMDAAMTLVPEGYCVSAMGEVPDDCDWYCCLWGENESEGEPERRAKTLPLAITSATLRARASIGKGE